MRKLFTLCLLVFSLSVTAQWQQTGSKVRYVNGLGIPTKDTAAGVAADSSQILIRPADSSLYIKYKRTWVKVGSGGGGVGGSGTTNRVPKFTASTTLGNSSIVDSASAVAMTINPSGDVGIGTASPNSRLDVVDVKAGANFSGITVWNNTSDAAGVGSTISLPVFNGSSGGVIQEIGNSFDGYRLNIYQAQGTGVISFGTGGNNERMRITSGGNALIGTTTDNGTDRLQVSGSMSVSARATAQNLSVTNNISVTNDINQGSGTANANYTMLANGTSSGWAGRFVAEYATGQFYFQHRNNSPTWTTCFQLNANGGKGGTSFWDNVNIRGDGILLVNNPTDNGVDKLQVAGSILGTGFAQSYTAKTGTYTATTSDYFIDCTSGTFTVNLFTAVGNTGRILIIKNSGTGTITVDPNGSQTIDGATTQSLSTQYSRVHIISDGANWKIISN